MSMGDTCVPMCSIHVPLPPPPPPLAALSLVAMPSSSLVAGSGVHSPLVCGLLISVASLVGEHRFLGAQASVVAGCQLSS